MTEITRLLWVRLLLLAIWLTLATGATTIVDPDTDTSALFVVLLAATTALGLLRPFPMSHLLFAGIGALIYALVQGVRASAGDADPNAPHLPAAAVGAFALVLNAIVAEQIARSLRAYDSELTTQLRLVEELETVDPATGAVKHAHAQRLISEEVDRARRYQRNLTVVMLGPDQWDDVVHDRGSDGAERLIEEVGRAYVDTLRSIDRLIHIDGPDFAALLPETELEGARIAAEKLCTVGSSRFGVAVRAGIASFPEDDVTGDGLMAEVDKALSFARVAQIPVASRSLLT